MILTHAQTRCHRCGMVAYLRIWLDLDPPDGSCPHGAKSGVCEPARERAELHRWILDGREGTVPLPEPPGSLTGAGDGVPTALEGETVNGK